MAMHTPPRSPRLRRGSRGFGGRAGLGRCKVISWFPSGADEFVGVQCYTQTTALTDSQFTLSFYQP